MNFTGFRALNFLALEFIFDQKMASVAARNKVRHIRGLSFALVSTISPNTHLMMGEKTWLSRILPDHSAFFYEGNFFKSATISSKALSGRIPLRHE